MTISRALVICVLLLPSAVTAQAKRDFSPLPITDTIPAGVQRLMKERLKKDKAALDAKVQSGNYMRSLYDQRYEYLVDNFNKDYVMVNDPISNFLTSVKEKIYDANPQLPRETRVYTYRSESPNAVSFGEGTICVMLGLLERLETEDQIAFVLCHELAHYHLDHARKSIEKLAAVNFDKGLKKQIDAINSSPYDRYTKLKKLFTELGFSMNRHSREFESEADSVGLIYYQKTRYNINATIRVMEILDQADNTLYPALLNLKQFFEFKEYPFKQTWAEYKKSTTWHASRDEYDTARTHPLAKHRSEALKRQINRIALNASASNENPVGELRYYSALEIIHSDYYFKKYGKSLFRALVLSNQYPGDSYVQAMIGKSLYQLYEAQKNHKLNNSLELPDPRFEENYDRFLTFMSNLRLNEIASLAYYYATTRPEEFYKTEEGLHALWLCSQLSISKVDPEKVREGYEQLYANGKYSREMKNNKP